MGVGVKSDHYLDEGIFKFFTHISGASAANGDLTDMRITGTDATPGKFGFLATGKAHVQRVHIHLTDGGVDPSKFGGIAALTSGVEVAGVHADGTTAIDFLDGSTWKQNSDLAYLGGPSNNIASGNPNGVAGVRWTLSRAYDESVTLHSGEGIIFVIRDNIGALTEFRTMIQGHYG